MFNTYIDPTWNGADDIYDNAWRKGRKESVLNLVSMVRQEDNPIDNLQYKGKEMFEDLSTLFEIGNTSAYNLYGHIENRSSRIILRFNTKHRNDKRFVDAVSRLAACHSIKPGYHFWKWLQGFLVHNLFLECKYKDDRQSKITIYEYHIDMTDWLWYYIKRKDRTM